MKLLVFGIFTLIIIIFYGLIVTSFLIFFDLFQSLRFSFFLFFFTLQNFLVDNFVAPIYDTPAKLIDRYRFEDFVLTVA